MSPIIHNGLKSLLTKLSYTPSFFQDITLYYPLSKQGGGAEFFHLLHEKQVQAGAMQFFLVHEKQKLQNS